MGKELKMWFNLFAQIPNNVIVFVQITTYAHFCHKNRNILDQFCCKNCNIYAYMHSFVAKITTHFCFINHNTHTNFVHYWIILYIIEKIWTFHYFAWAGIGPLRPFSLQWLNQVDSHLDLFQLERPLVEELYQQYRIDFDMFGYSPQLYIDIAKKATEVQSPTWSVQLQFL